MINKAPIFLNCFSRGGSNILWNMFLTHPDVCSPIRETLDIFSFNLKRVRVEGSLAALLSRQWRLFDQWHLKPRSAVPKTGRQYIDKTLYRWKLKTLHDDEMKFKTEADIYSLEEVERARLVAKNNNGLAFLSDLFFEMYPDATFFALVRHPLALYESHQRRQIFTSAEQFAEFYRRLATRMIEDEVRFEHYHVVKFEDLVADPLGSIKQLYGLANLDFGPVTKIRFKAKAHLQSNGRHTSSYAVGQHYWFEPEALDQFLEPKINQYQASRLEPAEKAMLYRLTAPVLTRLGYE